MSAVPNGPPTTVMVAALPEPPHTYAAEAVVTPTFYTDIGFSPSVEDPRSLVFIRAPGAPKLPDAMLTLRQEFVRTARVVSVLFEEEKEIRRDLFNQLHVAADCGFRGPSASIEDGRDNLAEVRENIADRAIRIRDQRLRQYTWQALVFGVIPMLMGVVLLLTDGFGYLKLASPGSVYDQLTAWVLAAFWIPAGASICVWGEFALRMQAGLTYEQLLNLDPSRWRPGQRLIVTVGISFIFAFILAFKIIQVGVGSILLNDFIDKTPALALAVGGVTALAFATVRDIIFRASPAERR
jgi:hypothetical protein